MMNDEWCNVERAGDDGKLEIGNYWCFRLDFIGIANINLTC